MGQSESRPDGRAVIVDWMGSGLNTVGVRLPANTLLGIAGAVESALVAAGLMRSPAAGPTIPWSNVDNWRRVCMEAFDNLPGDTTVTMADIDAVLLDGARDAAALDTSDPYQARDYRTLVDRLSHKHDLSLEDVDSILLWRGKDAAALIV